MNSVCKGLNLTESDKMKNKFNIKTRMLAFFTQKKVWRVTKFYGAEYGNPSLLMGGNAATMVLHEAIGYAKMWIDYEYKILKPII